MAWRVLRHGAMLEVVTGVLPNGKEQSYTTLFRQDQVLKNDLPREYVQRYLANDPYVRSTVEYGHMETVEDKDAEGGTREQWVATAGPDLNEALATPEPKAVEAAKGAEAYQARIEELEGQAKRFDESYGQVSTRVSELEAELEQVKAERDEAQEAATSGISYQDLSSEALAVEAEKRGVKPETGTGANGNVVKGDLVKALEEAHRS